MSLFPTKLLRVISNINTLTAALPFSSASEASKTACSVQQTRKNSTTTTETTCPHFTLDTAPATVTTTTTNPLSSTAEWAVALPYNEIPGPRPIPILGNTWRYV